VMLVYDITRMDTFANLEKWDADIEHHCKDSRNDVVRMVVGNKIDLSEQRQVTQEDAQRWAEDRGMLYMEVSATDTEQVDTCFAKPIYEVSKTAAR